MQNYVIIIFAAHIIYIYLPQNRTNVCTPLRQTHYGGMQTAAFRPYTKKERHKNEKAYKKFAGRTKMLNFAIITDMHNAYGDIQGNLNHTL